MNFRTTRNPGSIVQEGMSIRTDLAPPPNTRRTKYPFGDMRINDCLELAPGHPGARRNRGGTTSAQGSAHSYSRRHGVVFRSQVLPDGTVRIWRVA